MTYHVCCVTMVTDVLCPVLSLEPKYNISNTMVTDVFFFVLSPGPQIMVLPWLQIGFVW